LDVPSTSNGGIVQQANYSGANSQELLIRDSGAGNGTRVIQLANAPTKCVESPGTLTANGTLLDVSDCNGGANQQWTLVADTSAAGVYAFKNAKSGRCMDLPNGNAGNGIRIEIWDCNNGGNQKFRVVTDADAVAPPISSGNSGGSGSTGGSSSGF